MCGNMPTIGKSSSHEQFAAEAPARQESIQNQKRQYLVQDINALFGHYNEVDAPSESWYQNEKQDFFPGYQYLDGDTAAYGLYPPGYKESQYDSEQGKNERNIAKEGAMPPFTWDNDFYRTETDLGPYEAAMQQWRDENARAKTEAGTNQTARQGQYDDLLRDTVAFYTNDLNRQAEDAARQQKFSAARRGVTAGSSDTDQKANLLEEFNRGTLDVANRGQSAVTDLRSADEQARLDLISRVNAGMDANSALSAATEAIRNALAQASNDATYQGLGQVFTNYANYMNQKPEQSQYVGTGSTNISNRPRYQGRVGSI